MNQNHNFYDVEQNFLVKSKREKYSTNLPYIVVPNFPALGFLTALRFLEWASQNPEDTVSLPTGKTPEHFIKWTRHLLENWDKPEMGKMRIENGLNLVKKPGLKNLRFVQIDEFYPINPKQQNSFYNYVMHYYIKGFGLDKKNALLINTNKIE